MRNPVLLGGLALVLAALALVIAIISLFSAAPEPAAPAPAKSDQPGYTVSLVDRAIDYYQANGRQAALDYYNSPDSVDGRWYVFIYDENNVRVAHPTVKSLLGKPVDGPTGVDLNGYAYGQDMVKTTEAGQWVSYVFLNPSTGREEVKHTWLRKHDGLIFGSGWYEGNHQLPAKSNPTGLHRLPGAAGPPPLRPGGPSSHPRLLQLPGKPGRRLVCLCPGCGRPDYRPR